MHSNEIKTEPKRFNTLAKCYPLTIKDLANMWDQDIDCLVMQTIHQRSAMT